MLPVGLVESTAVGPGGYSGAPVGPPPVGPNELADLSAGPVPRLARDCTGGDAWERFEMLLRPRYGYVMIERLVLTHYSQMSVDLPVGCGRLCITYTWAAITLDMEP